MRQVKTCLLIEYACFYLKANFVFFFVLDRKYIVLTLYLQINT